MASNSNLELALKIKAAVDGLQAVESLIDEIEGLGGSAGKAGEQGKALASELDRLTDQAALIERFRQLKTQTAGTASQLAAAQDKAQALGKEFAATERPTKSLSGAFDKARAEVSRLKDAEQAQRRQLQNLRAELSGAGIDTRQLADAQVRIRTEMNASEAEVKQLASQLGALRDKTRQKFKDPTPDLRRGFSSLGKTILGAGAALTAFLGIREGFALIKRGLMGILQTGGEFQQLNIRFTSLMGSVASGEQAFGWVKKFAKDTPLQLEQVADAFAKLKAFGLDPMDGTLQAITDSAAKLGGGYQTLEGISLALGQAWAKQKLQGEEILQLIERGVPVWDLLAKATGKNTQELQKLSSAGELGRDVIKSLIAEMGKSAQGAATKQMATLNGVISNLKDSYQQFLDLIASSGALDFVTDKLSALEDKISELAADGRLKQYAQQISDALVNAGKSVTDFIARFDFEKAITSMSLFTTGITANLGLITGTLKVMAGTSRALFNYFSAGVKTVGLVVSGVAVGVAKLRTVILQMYNKVGLASDDEVRKAQNLLTTFKEASKGYADGISKDAQDIEAAWRLVEHAYDKSGAAATAAAEKAKAAAAAQAQAAKLARIETDRQNASFAALLQNIGAIRNAAAAQPTIDALTNLFHAGKISADGYGYALDQVNTWLRGLPQSAAPAAAAVAKVGSSMASATTQAAELKKQVDAIFDKLSKAPDTAAVTQALAQADQFYRAGKISVDQYAKAVDDSIERQKSLAGATRTTAAATHAASGQQLADLQKTADQIETNTEGLDKHMVAVGNFAAAFYGLIDGARQSYAAISDGAAKAFDDISRASTIAGGSISGYLASVAAGTRTLRRVIKENQTAAAALIERMNDANGATRRNVDLAQQAIRSNDLLGKEQLSQLQAALNRVNSQMQTLRANSAATLGQLKDELDQLQGDQAAIEQRHFEQQIAQLEAQLGQARRFGDRDLIEQLQHELDLAEKIHRIKAQGVRDDAQAAARKRREDALPRKVTPLPTRAAAAAAPLQEKQVTVNLVGVAGQRVSGRFDEDDAQSLIDLLQQAGLRAQT